MYNWFILFISLKEVTWLRFEILSSIIYSIKYSLRRTFSYINGTWGAYMSSFYLYMNSLCCCQFVVDEGSKSVEIIFQLLQNSWTITHQSKISCIGFFLHLLFLLNDSWKMSYNCLFTIWHFFIFSRMILQFPNIHFLSCIEQIVRWRLSNSVKVTQVRISSNCYNIDMSWIEINLIKSSHLAYLRDWK